MASGDEILSGGIARPHGRARIETPTTAPPATPGSRIARPHGRARIETFRLAVPFFAPVRIARPHGRARIETRTPDDRSRLIDGASPGLTAGRGLKHPGIDLTIAETMASPGLTAGRGLKHAMMP